MRHNPYMAGDPVGKQPSFVGREDVLREVLRVLRHPQQNAITLYGQRCIGKTSILQYLEAQLPKGPYLPVYFDLMNFRGKSLDTLLQELAVTIASALKTKKPVLGKAPRQTFRENWLPNILKNLSGDARLILLMDEFDMQADQQLKQEFFAYMRALHHLDPAHLKFVFVLGRTIDDLDIVAKGLFKDLPSHRVSLLARKGTERLIRLSERQGGLQWTDDAVKYIWDLTHGQPYLIQALCNEVWERACEKSNAPTPVTDIQVDNVVSDVMKHSEKMFTWLWKGLGPVEKVVTAALAEASPTIVNEEQLRRTLSESGVRVLIRELHDALNLLKDWDILKLEDGGYRFRVTLLRCWIAKNKPLSLVQSELDRINPFTFGDPISGESFLNRKRELRHLVTRIRQGGSTIITAEPRMGKTSLLLHLQAKARDLFGKETSGMLFHYLDGHTMNGWDAEHFWLEVFRPLAARWKAAQEPYAQKVFEATVWEPVFKHLEKRGNRFVLLLDEFDALQNEPALHQRNMYGMLRSLGSRYHAFSLVIAARHSITEINHQVQAFASGSPYFNFAQEITLQPFPQKDVDTLLARAGKRFTPDDRAFIRRIAGQHPYFLQTAAYYLWDWYEETEDVQERYEGTGRDFFAAAGESVLSDIWTSWTPYMQMAFTIAALDNIPHLLPGRQFDIQTFLKEKNLSDFSPELRKLERRGFLSADSRLQSGYTPRAEVMLWFLADELTRALRDKRSLKEWLEEQQWEGLLKHGALEALTTILRRAGELFESGAITFIKVVAESMAKRITGG